MNKLGILNSIKDSIHNNYWLYIIGSFCIILGTILGIYTLGYLDTLENNQLVSYLNDFLNSIVTRKINNNEVFIQAVKNNIPLIVGIWFLGLTLIGIPIILVIDLIKGYTLGFTIGFIIKSFGTKGIWIVLMGVIPQNIFYIICFLVASVTAMSFSVNFLKNNLYKHFKTNIFLRLISYTITFIIIILFMTLGFIFEAYFTGFFIKLII